MTLQTQQVHLAHPQVPRIVRPMRRVATGAPFRFHGHVFVHERPLLVGVALHANCIAGRDCFDLPYRSRPVYVVAVATLQQTLVYAVVIGPGEIRFCRHMTAVTEVRLRADQQMFWLLGLVGRVAVEASNIVAGMRRSREMALLPFLAMTAQAACAGSLRGQCREPNNLGDVPTAVHVCRSGAVTRFAAMPSLECGFEVWGQFKVIFVNVFVTGLAGVRSDILGGVILCGCAVLVSRAGRSRPDG